VSAPFAATGPLDDEAWQSLKVHAIFRCCKWDLQREDRPVIARYALVLDRMHWRTIAEIARRLAEEALVLEQELLARPELHSRLALPRPIRAVLRGIRRHGGIRATRVMRFDFHHTTDGWRISEVNADVPGGFIESSRLTEYMARHYSGLRALGNPARAYAEAIRRLVGEGGSVALVHATAYSDDRQVMEYLARYLRADGLRAMAVSPANIRFEEGQARIESRFASGAAHVLVRFFPAEWLPNLGRRALWSGFFASRATGLSNPATAVLVQSKRMPLVWDAVPIPLDAWRASLPEVRSPRDVPAAERDDWVWKPALGRVGESFAIAGVTKAPEFDRISRRARVRPGEWIAQRRFRCLPIETPDGPGYPCLGVFTIDGRPAGCYGRISMKPLIDSDAQDVAVLSHDC
jgi:glutathionylspermidine synthase